MGGGVPEVRLWAQNMKYLNTKIKFFDIKSKLGQYKITQGISWEK